MREITRIMAKDFKLMKLGYDFAGYKIHNKEDLSFHHLVISRKQCKKLGIEEEGYTYSNGAILVQKTSHDYIHIIERYDREIFDLITKEMIEENLNGKLDIENLRRIRDLLLYFEKEHQGLRSENGKQLIRREYLRDRIEI